MGRMAACYSSFDGYHSIVPSSTDLPFFRDTGPTSESATESCTCGFHKIAHGVTNPATGRPGITDHEFVSRGPFEYDSYYCGHDGFD